MRLFLLALLGALLAPALFAQDDGVLMFGDDINVERIDLDALLSEGPPHARKNVLNNKKRILRLLRQVYLIRALAAEYEEHDLAEDKLMQAKLQRQRDKLLYLERLKQIDAEPIPEFEQAAKEQYQGNPEAYTIPEKVETRHILISTTDRFPVHHERDEALKIANEVKAKLDAGGNFETLVRLYSEDPRTNKNQGALGIMKRTAIKKPVVKAAFELEKPGDISEVVESEFGFHIVKLVKRFSEEKRTFEQVKREVIDKMRKDFIQNRREAYFDELLKRNNASIYEDLVEEYIAEGLEALEKQPE
jgi:peptidyl-prolyl cis-trans isomerase C